MKEAQICEMKLKLNDLVNSVNVNEAERINLNKTMNGLNEITCANKVKIMQLRGDWVKVTKFLLRMIWT